MQTDRQSMNDIDSSIFKHLPGSISIASRFLTPATFFLDSPTRSSKLSDSECAGSVRKHENASFWFSPRQREREGRSRRCLTNAAFAAEEHDFMRLQGKGRC
jgi:hypothetical protein